MDVQYLNGQVSIFDLIRYHEMDVIGSSKVTGAVYTPENIIEYMVSNADIGMDTHIIEPSCGHGAFVFGILEYMKTICPMKNLYSWFVSHVDCYDISEKTILDFHGLLTLWFRKHGFEYNEFPNVQVANTLKDVKKTYDLCIGNPPYIRNRNMDKNTVSCLRKNYDTCKKGNIDIYYAFTEFAIKHAKQSVLIIPNSFLTTKCGSVLKNMVMPRLTKIIDFRNKLMFDNARIYTCILFMTDKTDNNYLYSESLDGPVEQKIWNNKITPVKIDDLPTIYSGIATLRDSIYIVKKDHRYLFEDDILVPYMKITTAYRENHDYIIYPYNEQQIIDENTMQNKYPKAYKHLCDNKEQLMLRDKGNKKYETWYAYGRKQGMKPIDSNDVILVPIMIGGKCIPKRMDITPIKKNKMLLFTSGYIIPYNDVTKYLLDASFMEFIQKTGKSYPGKQTPYYTIGHRGIIQFLTQVT